MELIVDEEHRGPSEAEWASRLSTLSLPPFGDVRDRRVIVVAPHPDDEVLGAGGLIQHGLRGHCRIEIVAVTDGEASHPASRARTAKDVAALRARESVTALRRLGWSEPVITRLHIPDGAVEQHETQLVDALTYLLSPGDLCIAPWSRDGHPDHDAAGRAARLVSRRREASCLAYLIWAWHWTDPQTEDIPWSRCRRLDLSPLQRLRKRWSMAAFASQVKPIGPEKADAPIVPKHVLRRFWRRFECYVGDEVGDS